jgi:hypothetical protein
MCSGATYRQVDQAKECDPVVRRADAARSDLHRQFDQIAVRIGDDTFIIAVAGTAWFGYYDYTFFAQRFGQLANPYFAAERNCEVSVSCAKPGIRSGQAGFAHQLKARTAGREC